MNTHPLVSGDVCIGQAKVFSGRGTGTRGGQRGKDGGAWTKGMRRKTQAAWRVPGIKEFAILNFPAMSYTYITLYECIYFLNFIHTGDVMFPHVLPISNVKIIV